MKTFFVKFVIVILFFGTFACQNNTENKEDNNNETEEQSGEENTENEETAGNKYVGEWESVASENLGNGSFATRYFNLKDENWEIKFTLFLDSLQEKPVFVFRAVGKYEVQDASEKIEGADNAIFKFDNKYVTLLTDDEEIIKNFGMNECGLEKDTEKDITKDGCSFLVSKEACGQEFDLLKLDNEQLFFGMRPSEGDMCTEENRPTALFYPLKKK